MPDFLHGIEVIEIDNGTRPISTVASSMIGFVGTAPDADAALFPADMPVLIAGPRQAAALGAAGTLLDAYQQAYAEGVSTMVVVRVTAGATPAETKAAVIGSATAGTGIWALMNARPLLGVTPRILAAPGHSANAPGATEASPVATALIALAERLKGAAVIDGPNTTEAAAAADVELYGSHRILYCDPAVRVWDRAAGAIVTRPYSSSAAGALSFSDATRGFWHSHSNIVLKGIVGTARPIGFAISDPETEANRLNKMGITTIVNQNGFRTWGNRTPGADANWAFLSVRRTADMIYDSIDAAMLWAMDRPFGEQLLRDIRDSVKAYITTLVTRGALLGGDCWLDPELNTEATLKAGHLYLDFDIEPPAPLERLTFRAFRNGSYYDELVSAVAAVS
ncbi:Phage tail sheath protein [Paracoccus haematequi]|uniref:Phage tail sheath protein n=1 Tax=Paracoccus haematequi TaxID=2491866 RepID=A0A3S4ESN2_9RHOB|nr:phage tail sheath C-terminal domain-containing protein [Paracoccus haematequi]VDS09243.1 Phage tail sheath protein [Paracoccus haematequi]